jgi:hypothetical protein
MSDNKWDKEQVDLVEEMLLDLAPSGSYDDKFMLNDLEPMRKIPTSVVMPFEDWTKLMPISAVEKKAISDYNQTKFPDLYEPRGIENDKFSTQPILALTKPARVYSTLLEAAIVEEAKEKLKKKKKKISH